ncbi:unnamed protein product [Darwinula stevensoni]|uniref:ABC transporter domain-containing protein n=1 Tax=Darwinula stevensoni TaxID=69355 RepID=A0A7R8X1T0_9CRUS|nr:unnamed protein product [Darwinula stevensoni]CAG0883098.1 unnamed protein product [Darwinula stevensoni]
MVGIAKRFLLLAWKNLLLRKRHPVLTGLEFVLPALLFGGMYWMNLQLQRTDTETQSSDQEIFPPENETDLMRDFAYRPRPLLIAPNETDLAQTIIGSLKETYEGFVEQDEIRTFRTEEELLAYVNVNHMSDWSTPSAIVFVEGDEKTFRYKIRSNTFSQGTSLLFSEFPMPGPNIINDVGYLETFIPLQLLVNSAWIRAKNGWDPFHLNHTEPIFKDVLVGVRRMPYPNYKGSVSESFISILFGLIIPMFTVFGYLFVVPVQHLSIVREKQSGIKELMKMMGMPRSLYWLSHFVNGSMSVVLISFIGTMFLSVGGILKDSDGFLIFLLLLLYGLAFLGFSYLITTFFHRLLLTIPLAMILTLVTYMAPTFSLELWRFTEESLAPVTPGSAVALCFLPNMALVFGIRILAYLEGSGGGLTWANLQHQPFADQVSVGFVLVMLLVDTVLYLLLTGYMDVIRPGKYGLAEPFYFFLKPSFWCPRRKAISDGEELERRSSWNRKSRFFEEDLRYLKAGIEIRNLKKVFRTNKGPKVAVDGLSLSACEGDITVLLGHNGAGKTTTMSIITGLYSATGGTAIVNGYDIRHNMDKVRGSLGLCPQHSMLFPELTVQEHIMLFGQVQFSFRSCLSQKNSVAFTPKLYSLQLKGLTRRESLNIGQEYAARLSLPLNRQARTLSGGMKRKLSLIIALIGKTKVVILDEPSSGLDPEARRVVWTILQEEKRDRTILLTTHFMEEADVLGDRIAIMAHGHLQCVGSSMFLKRQYGTGYTLTVTKTPGFAEGGLLSLLQKFCPEATLKSNAGSEASYMLPSSSTQVFPSVLESLDRAKAELGIRSFGISATTFEEVFLRVGEGADIEDGDARKTRPIADASGTSRATTSSENPLSYILRHSFILPLAMVVGALLIDRAQTGGNADPPALNMNVDVYGKNFVPYEIKQDLNENLMNSFLEGLPDSSTSQTMDPSEEDFIQYLLSIGSKDESEYRVRYVIGGSLAENRTQGRKLPAFTAYYQTIPLHSSGIAVNHMSDAVAKFLLGPGHSIVAFNHPYESQMGLMESFMNLQSTEDGMWLAYMNSSFTYAYIVGLGMMLLACTFVVFPAEENGSSAKQLQLMTGVRPELYWVSHLVGDGVVYLLITAVIIGIMAGIDTNGIFADNYGSLGSLFLLLVLYGFASLPFAYVISFRFKNRGTAFAIHALISVFFGIPFLPTLVMEDLTGSTKLREATKIGKWFLGFFPSFSFPYGMLRLTDLAYKNRRCELIEDSVKDFVCSAGNGFSESSLSVCCDNCEKLEHGCFKPVSYIKLEGLNIAESLIMMVYSGLFWFAFLLLLEYRLPQRVWARLFSFEPPNVNRNVRVDEDVQSEEERINQLLRRGETEKDALLAVGLRKSFNSFVAVDHLNIGVHQGECFGLLGVNGAGKTTTFKMLTGAELLTKGVSYNQGYDLKKQRSKYLYHVGYCPQFDALVDVMTGRETLWMYARLRGIPESSIGPHVDALIDKLGLAEYKEKYCGTYSGGNKRKLSTAVAMVGEPTLLFLDEPTSGVDPVSRRNIWQALTDCTKNGQSIVLTSHSMEECESLCHRLGIMVNGRFRCLGNPQYLKDKFCQGYSIKVKTAISATAEDIAYLKAFLTHAVPGTYLQDEYMGLLNFRVLNVNVTWAQLFSAASEMKARFPAVVEDSLVGETSLEQVFLSFASEQIGPRPKARCRLCPCSQ